MKPFLIFATIFALVACQKKEEIPEVKIPTVKEVFAEAMVHPGFVELSELPEVKKADERYRNLSNGYNHVMYTHPQIVPIVEQTSKLAPDDPMRSELAKRMQELAKVLPELQEKKGEIDQSRTDLIRAYGEGYQKIEGGEEISTRIKQALAAEGE